MPWTVVSSSIFTITTLLTTTTNVIFIMIMIMMMIINIMIMIMMMIIIITGDAVWAQGFWDSAASGVATAL